MEEDEILVEIEGVKRRWGKTVMELERHAQSLASLRDAAAIPKLNAMAQDSLSTLRSLQLQLELLAQQLFSLEDSNNWNVVLNEWRHQYQILQSNLRIANLQAKANIQKAAKEDRQQLLSGGKDSTSLRQKLRTEAGMVAASENITETFRRTRQMMVQELERGASTLTTLDDSNLTMKKAESEYKGQHSLLMTTKRLLTVMKRQDILDRVILGIGFVFFCLVFFYVFHQRIGTFRTVHRLSQMLSSHTQDQPHVPSEVRLDISYVEREMRKSEALDHLQASTSETPIGHLNPERSLQLEHDEL